MLRKIKAFIKLIKLRKAQQKELDEFYKELEKEDLYYLGELQN